MNFDRMCKKFGMRNVYHTLYSFMIKALYVNDTFNGERVIKY